MTVRLLALIALLFVSACGQIPRPFMDAPQAMSDNPLLDVPTAGGIAVVPMQGVPDALSESITRSAASRLQTFEIPAEAVPVNTGLGFTLEGVAESATSTPSGRQVSILWTLKSRRGAVTGTHRQSITVGEDIWKDGSGETPVLMGREVATAMAALLGATTPEGPTSKPASAPAGLGLPAVSVRPVEGAPGDGRESLRLAVIQILNENGVRRDDVSPDVILTCAMRSMPASDGLQQVEIEWRATTSSGADLGSMRLDNTIPNGALDGAWGPTAFAIADAAAADLMTLITATPKSPAAK